MSTVKLTEARERKRDKTENEFCHERFSHICYWFYNVANISFQLLVQFFLCVFLIKYLAITTMKIHQIVACNLFFVFFLFFLSLSHFIFAHLHNIQTICYVFLCRQTPLQFLCLHQLLSSNSIAHLPLTYQQCWHRLIIPAHIVIVVKYCCQKC